MDSISSIGIPVNVFNAVARYLEARPFLEVVGLINALAQAQQAATGAVAPVAAGDEINDAIMGSAADAVEAQLLGKGS